MAEETKIYIDLKIFSEELADKVAQGLNTRVRIFAKQNVAVDSGDLRDSIRTSGTGGRYQTIAGGVMGTDRPSKYRKNKKARMIAYALAQEFGRPDLPRYTFTPYMRPAAMQASEPGVVNEVLREATDAALRKSKV